MRSTLFRATRLSDFLIRSMAPRNLGHGFDVPRRWIQLARQGHLGLVGMWERVESIDGTLKIVSTPGTGTEDRITVDRPREQEPI